jgi:hypothetical protein
LGVIARRAQGDLRNLLRSDTPKVAAGDVTEAPKVSV